MVCKKIAAALVLGCLLAFGAQAAQAAQSPTERVREGVDKIIQMLSDPAMQDPAQHDEAITRLREVAEQYIDFGLVTKFAVGRPWLEMSPELHAQLREAFVKLLERSYLKRIPAYGGQNVNYTREEISGNNAKVQTEIIDKDKKIVVEFRLKIVQGKWMIYDVVAEGVSLVMNYRSQFAEVLNKGTGEDLLKTIQDRIEQIDQGKEEEPAS
ncbi:Toluene tolerance, Ttg2 [Pseudodesulfovibrio hydrargyri]|uniref:Toluene tolerance, Ttg2 n=1 Tax=Pseudodesulfovibrio hydrargyri TaxID=2125990 RepID=A0A1J5MUJ0_9BACT|nr:ABC transporter substrate-binding protein [Pseudodesulfovibrio hydrargyri]OIQ49524.1 Toluene tolerance, Ttg2 [Pseudodesulfovibrio hydrargyri]